MEATILPKAGKDITSLTCRIPCLFRWKVQLKERAYFCHNDEIQASTFTGLTDQDKIAFVRQHARNRWGTTSTHQIKKPMPRRVLNCEEG